MHLFSSFIEISDYHLHQKPGGATSAVIMPDADLLQRSEWFLQTKGEIVDASSGEEYFVQLAICQRYVTCITIATIDG